MASLFSELKRRNVFRVAAAYAVGGWILIEAGSVLMPTFGVPDGVFKVYAVIVIAGFVLATIFSWIFEFSSEGIRRTEDVPDRQSVAPITGRRLDWLIIGLLIVALGISVTLNITGLRGSAGSDAERRASIAVLPFASRSANASNAFFADGIHDDLLTSLAKIGSLKVISRTSVMEYRDTTKNLKQIGGELGVRHVLEGSVQRVGENVRINVQLIDAESDDHLWAQVYDRELTTENIFSIQSEISTNIADALKAALTPGDRARLKSRPTGSLEAYNLYLAGRNNVYQRRLDNLFQARNQFEQAIALDPNYAQAYSGLSDSLMLILINHQALSPDEVYPLAQAAVDRALELDTEDAEIYASLGLIRMHQAEWKRSKPELVEAATALERAIELNPNHAQAFTWYASVQGLRGRPEKAIELLEKALELDPLARIPQSNLAEKYAELGHNDEALAQWLGAVRFHPDWPTAYDNVADHLAGLGRLDEAFAWFRKARQLSMDPLVGRGIVAIELEFGRRERVDEFLDAVPPAHPMSALAEPYRRLFDGDFVAASSLAERLVGQGGIPDLILLDFASDAALLAGEFARSRSFFEQLWPAFADPGPPAVKLENSDDAIRYAYVLQQLGEEERASAYLNAALGLLQRHHRMGARGYGIHDVQALALLGRREQAMKALRTAVDAGWRSAAMYNNWILEQDPLLVPLREDPEFRSLAAAVRADIERMRERVERAEATREWEQLLAAADTGGHSRGRPPK